MMEIFSELVKKLKIGPGVLFLGQKYLQIETDTDFLLKTFSKKNNHSFESYDNYLSVKKEDVESVHSWMSELCNALTPPEWLKTIAKIPWGHIYTSSIDNIIFKTFQNNWREVEEVFSEQHRKDYYRSSINLHLTYLFGSIKYTSIDKRPPNDRFNFLSKKTNSNALLKLIPEIVSARGVLVFCGYDLNDWCSIEELYPHLDKLGRNQVYFFDTSDEFSRNPFVLKLVEDEKIIVFRESIINFAYEIENESEENLFENTHHRFGTYIKTGNKKIVVPDEIKRAIDNVAYLINEATFNFQNPISDEEKISEFRKFQSSGSNIPLWRAYVYGFVFKRKYFERIISLIYEKLAQAQADIESVNKPIILYGQASSGKTTCLGMIAHELYESNHKVAILFIEKRYVDLDTEQINKIDDFCKWTEDQGVESNILLWDCNATSEKAMNNLLRILNSRGRKIIIIGTTYKLPGDNVKSNYIEAKIQLEAGFENSKDEKSDFTAFIKQYVPSNSEFYLRINSIMDKSNFLAVLYYFLPDTKSGIRDSLSYEYSKIMSLLYENYFLNDEIRSDPDLTDKIVRLILTEDEGYASHKSMLTRIIHTIIVSHQYGLDIPFELLIRSLNLQSYPSDMFSRMNDFDIIRWREDRLGNIVVGGRTTLESTLLSRSLGNKENLLYYILSIIDAVNVNSPAEIDYLIKLLVQLKDEKQTVNFRSHLLDIAEALKKVRLSGRENASLMLQEGTYIREFFKSVKNINRNNNYNREDLLNKLNEAEEIVKEAKNLVREKRSSIYSHLVIEHATILATKATEFIELSLENSMKYYNDTKELVSVTTQLTSENYHALDVLLWLSKNILSSNKIDTITRLKVEAYANFLMDMADSEGIIETHQEEYNKRKLELGQCMSSKEKVSEAFNKLLEGKSSIGYYLEATYMCKESGIKFNEFLEDNKRNDCEKVFQYLFKNVTRILADEKDGTRAYYLMFRLWWMKKTGYPLLFGERLKVGLSDTDWFFCLNTILKLLLKCEPFMRPMLLFFKGLAQFHLGQYSESIKTFEELSNESDFSGYGRKRIVLSYIACDEDGHPRVFSGSNRYDVSFSNKGSKGEVYIPDLRITIPYHLNDLRLKSVTKDKNLGQFYIGFNFTGPRPVRNFQ